MGSLRYDVVVVGAGPAGSALAYFLTRGSEYSIAVVESKSWEEVWSKPCGNALGAHHVERLGLPEPSGPSLMQSVRSVRVFSPSSRNYVEVRGRGYIIDRKSYGQLLLREAERKGAELLLETRVLEPLLDSDGVVGIRASARGGTFEIRSELVVDASGVAAIVRRKLPREWPLAEQLDARDSNIAYRILAEVEEVEEPEVLRIYLDQEAAPGGYWWLFPHGGDLVNIGLGVQGGRNLSPASLLESLLSRRSIIKIKRHVASGGAQVPTRRPLDTLVWKGIAAVGDSAFHVNPLHGGGIGYAMTSAYCLSEALRSAAERGLPTSLESLWAANICYMHELGARQAALDLVRMFLQRLENEDLEFLIERGVVSGEDVDVLGKRAEIRDSVLNRVSSELSVLLKMAKRPKLLLSLGLLSSSVKRIKKIYEEYPLRPEELPTWSTRVRREMAVFEKELEKY
ncbi:MAG: geranylgeranyl reductase family protein [Fervidicoccaceae archaeon]